MSIILLTILLQFYKSSYQLHSSRFLMQEKVRRHTEHENFRLFVIYGNFDNSCRFANSDPLFILELIETTRGFFVNSNSFHSSIRLIEILQIVSNLVQRKTIISSDIKHHRQSL